MNLQTKFCFVLLEIFLCSFLLSYEGRKIEGYEFAVYSTVLCPKNDVDWKKRSSDINCTESNGYMCIPNENLTVLLEFCYIYPLIWIQKDRCLYLIKRYSRVDSYDCRNFRKGCPTHGYRSSDMFLHPSCINIANGCFSAETVCKRKVTTNLPESTEPSQFERETNNNENGSILFATVFGVFATTIICVLCALYFFHNKKFPKCKGNRNEEGNLEELTPLTLQQSEPLIEKAYFDQWEQEHLFFVPTKACKEVENKIKTQNIVIVMGHLGSGKSAIIQHIALKYKKRGWIVKPVNDVMEYKSAYSSGKVIKNNTLFVTNDPFGKESFDELLYNSWGNIEKALNSCLNTVKILMSCRKCILQDDRMKGFFSDKSNIVDINDEQCRLTVEERWNILNKYTAHMNLCKKQCEKIVQTEAYFPLLCRLYSRNENYQDVVRFFNEPVEVLKEEIRSYRNKSKRNFCALVLLIFFSDKLCIDNVLQNKFSEHKYRRALKLCGMEINTAPYTIGDTLKSMKGFLVKRIDNDFQFYHDFVMEVTTFVFGTDYPTEIIKYADIGFLRKRVKLGHYTKNNDPLTIYINEKHIEDLGKRLFVDIFGDRLLDVVLNPCLRNEKVISIFKKELKHNRQMIQRLLQRENQKSKREEQNQSLKYSLHSKLSFLMLEKQISPVCALIAFCHTDLSIFCLKTLQQIQADFTESFVLSSICCSGSKQLLETFSRDHVKLNLTEKWGCFNPIHITSLFHNYEILDELIQIGVDVNLRTGDESGWTPLLLAAGNDTTENGYSNREESGNIRRDKTVLILLQNKADVNLCNNLGESPLHVACKYGHDSTVERLLENEADVNFCSDFGKSPLQVACKYGHVNIVQILLKKADINVENKFWGTPLHEACKNGHAGIVQVLMNNGAKTNLVNEYLGSPLHEACKNGHDSIVRLLLFNGAAINLIFKTAGSSLHIACRHGHDSTVQILLENGADINLHDEYCGSPLYEACENRHESIVELLLRNKADINLSRKFGDSPLLVACKNGYNNIVKILLNNGADINYCNNYGESPLYAAGTNGHDITAQLLLKSGAKHKLM